MPTLNGIQIISICCVAQRAIRANNVQYGKIATFVVNSYFISKIQIQELKGDCKEENRNFSSLVQIVVRSLLSFFLKTPVKQKFVAKSSFVLKKNNGAFN